MKKTKQIKDGARCTVVAGMHAGKSGTAGDIKTSKSGHVTITVKQSNGMRFKVLAKNVVARVVSAKLGLVTNLVRSTSNGDHSDAQQH